MRKYHRLRLGRKAWVWLSLQVRRVLASPDPKKAAAELWRSTARHRYRREVHATLSLMASGTLRCMYCEDSVGHQIEHFWPKARYPERAFCWENLLVVCGKCNGHKLAQFPLDERGAPILIDPTAEDPAVHVTLNPWQGRLVARGGSRRGQATIDVLKLNRWELQQGRQNAWVFLHGMLVHYASCRASGRVDQAERCKQAICGMPFSALLGSMVQVLQLQDPGRYLHDAADLPVLGALLPELRVWSNETDR